jgi:hypothetical protein
MRQPTAGHLQAFRDQALVTIFIGVIFLRPPAGNRIDPNVFLGPQMFLSAGGH